MGNYEELIELLAHPADGRDNADIMISAVDAIEQLVRERDAAVAYLYNEADYYGDLCYFCAKNNDSPCIKCEWEWRGVQE